MNRKINFYAGPATLPLPVLNELKENMVDYKGMGMSLIETSHRSSEYDEVHNDAENIVKELLNLPADYDVLFLGGGATLQFSMVPMNLFTDKRECDFVISGSWAKKAYSDAKKLGKVNVLFDGSDSNYTTLPDKIACSPESSYVHITSNETIGGLQWQRWPETGNIPLVADMSSDIMSRTIPVDKFALIYAGAQKNLGPAGVTLVIIKKEMLERSSDNLTTYLNYKIHAEKKSLYNTPPVFGIYAVKLVLEWVKKQGGLEAIAEINRKKASLIYDLIDKSEGFYKCPVDKRYRSKMNIIFTLKNKELETLFLQGASSNGMVGLKGHRSVGGCRASIYNSMPVEGVIKLSEFMNNFHKTNG